MNASSTLARLKAAGVTFAANGSELAFDGPAEALTDGVLDELRAIKLEILALLSAPETQEQPVQPVFAAQATQTPADGLAVPGASTQTTDAPMGEGVIAEWRATIASVNPTRPEIDKLKTASLRFLDAPEAVAAVENGWDAVSLFGMHEGDAPKERIDAWGLVLFLAWGIHNCTVDTVGQKVCALRTGSGAVQTLPRGRANSDQAIPWWQHPGIVSDASNSSETSEPKGDNNTTSKGNHNAWN